MAFIRDEDIERDLDEHVQNAFGRDFPMHRAGEQWDGKPEAWASLRITAIDRSQPIPMSRMGEENYGITVTVTCYVRAGRKGGTFLDISKLTDTVRPAIDASCRAPAVKVRDGRSANRQVYAGIDFGMADQARSFNQTIDIGGASQEGVDVATLTVRCTVSRF